MIGDSSRQIRRNAKEDPLTCAVALRDSSVLDMVKDAVRHHQTRLALQPVVSTQADGKVVFYEGLIRVLDDTGRVIPAREFMPSVEENEIGRDIDRLSLHMGCKMLNENPAVRISVNISARSIGYQPWLRTLNRWLSRNDYIGPRLILEISEKSAMQVPELLTDFMIRLQPTGVCFALDNFGAGQTALRHFRDFCFDIVKIDGQFVKGICQDPDNQVLVQTMADIAENFDMMTVAEMVETAGDSYFVTQLGIDCAQGYFYGAPTTRPEWANQNSRQKSA